MAIITGRTETLTTYKPEDKVDLSYLIDKSTEFDAKWKNYIVDNSTSPHYAFTPDQRLILNSDGCTVTLDLTELAMQQLCQKLGVPMTYILKCFEKNQGKLAASNLNTWIKGSDSDLLVRTADGVARGIVTPSYVPYDNA